MLFFSTGDAQRCVHWGTVYCEIKISVFWSAVVPATSVYIMLRSPTTGCYPTAATNCRTWSGLTAHNKNSSRIISLSVLFHVKMFQTVKPLVHYTAIALAAGQGVGIPQSNCTFLSLWGSCAFVYTLLCSLEEDER